MLTLTCTIKFRGSSPVTARASAESPYDDVPVQYGGDVSKIPDRPEKCQVMALRFYMQIAADLKRGEFLEEYEGKFAANE